MSAYGAANDLAFFFLKERADLWLASHFFEKCLEFGKKIEDDGKMRESEAHCNVGIMEFFDGERLATVSSCFVASRLHGSSPYLLAYAVPSLRMEWYAVGRGLFHVFP